MTKRKDLDKLFVLIDSNHDFHGTYRAFSIAESTAKDLSEKHELEIFILEVVNSWFVSPPEEPLPECHSVSLLSFEDV